MKKDIIDKAVGKKYSEFSDAIKAELHRKMANHEVTQGYAKEYDRIQDMKNKFTEINSDTTEE